MIAVDIGDYWLSLEIRTGRGTRVSDRWKCAQAVGSTLWRPATLVLERTEIRG
jgi:hypothetical protein